MTIKQQIDRDLKQAMLAKDKATTMTLRGLKSVILYAEVAEGARDTGLAEEKVIELLSKEAKKRRESIMMYIDGDRQDRADTEIAEKAVIEGYLPEQMSEEDLSKLIVKAIADTGAAGIKDMGRVIGIVKQQTSGRANGGRIADKVKELLAE
ncbi:MAG: GatB/YqeY domain-containing protein [Candidatus Saccharimonadales bacterium]